MSEDQLKAFMAAVKGDPALEEQIKAASDVDAIVAIAQSAGFNFSAEEFNGARSVGSNELSDLELEGFAGKITLVREGCTKVACELV